MKRRVHPPLPVWEQTTYWLVFISGVAYGIYNVFSTSREIKDRDMVWLTKSEGLMETFSDRRDVGNFEWSAFEMHGIWNYSPLLLFHVIVSRAMQYLNLSTKHRRLGYILLGIWTIWQLQPGFYLLVLLIYPLVSYLLSCLGCVPLIWAYFGAVIFAMYWLGDDLHVLWPPDNYFQCFEGITYAVSFYTRCHYFALERTWALKQQAFSGIHQGATSSTSSSTNRCTEATKYEEDSENSPTKLVKRQKFNENTPTASHTSDIHQHANRSSPSTSDATTSAEKEAKKPLYNWPVLPQVPGLLELYFYGFYVPTLLGGPLVNFKTLIEESENPRPLTSQRLQCILWKLPRICFWIGFNHVLLHFFYFSAFGEDTELASTFNKWTLATTAWLIGQFMTNRYVVLYGLPVEVGKFDGFDLPESPACISYIYNYSDMWRSFDRGLHGCVTRYIYIPLGGGRAGFWRQQLSSLVVFFYNGLWHGIRSRFIIWALLNHAGVTLEGLGTYLEKTEIVQRHLMRKLNPAWDRRLRGLLSFPIFLLGKASNQFFMVSNDFGCLYATRICLELDSFVTIGVIVYSGIQVSKHLERMGHTKFS